MPEQLRQVEELANRIAQRRHHHRPLRRRGLDRDRHDLEVPFGKTRAVGDVAEQRVGRRTIGERMVQLGDDGDPSVGEAMADVEFPERDVAVEWRARDRLEFGHPARRRDVDRADVPGRVDLPVGDPERVVELERNRQRAALQRREQVEPGEQFGAQQRQVEVVRRVDERDLEGVHVLGRGLHVQKPGIHPGHPLHPGSVEVTGR